LLGVLGFNASLFRLFRLLQLLRTFSKVEKLRVIIESLSRAVRATLLSFDSLLNEHFASISSTTAAVFCTDAVALFLILSLTS